MPEESPNSLTPEKRRRAILILSVGSVAFGLLLLEIAARVMGYSGYSVPASNLKSISPEGTYFKKHEGLGYTHKPGTFNVSLVSGHTFTTTHDQQGFRITSKDPESRQGMPELWLMGCSFTHGWSLQDEETFPWLLQDELDEFRVRNFGISGYGTFQSRLLFQELIKTETKPKMVVYVYGRFHHDRNTYPRRHMKAQAPHNRMGPLSLPYARYDASGELEYYAATLDYQPWPLMNVSAAIHMLETVYNQRDARAHQSEQVTAELIRRWALFCQEQEIAFAVAGISSDSGKMLEFCTELGIRNVLIAVPLSEDKNRNLPHDDHPSPLANGVYAERLLEFLKPELEALR